LLITVNVIIITTLSLSPIVLSSTKN